MENRILNEYKAAMKNRDTLKSSVLSFLRAEMINVAVAKKKDKLDDNEVISVIKKQIKQRQDSIEQFNKGNRQDLAEKEMKELEILKAYLPPELSLSEVQNIIEEVISAVGAKSIQDMGKVMKEVVLRVAGQADGKLISDQVREKLSKASS